MIKIIVQGINGRMGKAVCALVAQRTDCKVVAGVDITASSEDIPVFTALSEVNVPADVLIDFSLPEASLKSLEFCCKSAMPVVLCTTGFSKENEQIIADTAKKTAVFKSGNMSLGVNLLIKLAQKASRVLGADYDIEIIEKHHNNKVDAPSGTALMIADAINTECSNKYHYEYNRHEHTAKRDNSEIGIHSVRGGNIVGEHEVIFAGQNEVISISHSAASREVFASGAVSAAVYIKDKKPGLYNMKDLIL